MSYSVSKPLINGKFPSGRGGCTTVYADGKLIAFGGHYFAGEGKFEYLNETWVFDIAEEAWHLVKCSGEQPAPRYGHSAHIIGSRMFIIDLIEWIWVPVNPLSLGPTARMNHASEVVGRRIVIHGGWNGEDTFDDLWIFNTDSFGWMEPRIAGFAPSPRFGHSMNLLLDGRLLLFGGCTLNKETGTPRYNNDIRALDTETMVWSRPSSSGDAPTGRYGHVALVRPDQKMVILGGWGTGGCQSSSLLSHPKVQDVHILDTDPSSMQWDIVPQKSKKPLRPLYNHSACLNEDGSRMFLFGGFDGRQASFDTIFVDLNLD